MSPIVLKYDGGLYIRSGLIYHIGIIIILVVKKCEILESILPNSMPGTIQGSRTDDNENLHIYRSTDEDYYSTYLLKPYCQLMHFKLCPIIRCIYYSILYTVIQYYNCPETKEKMKRKFRNFILSKFLKLKPKVFH